MFRVKRDWLAETQNANQIALEAGNSPQMIFKHYQELVRPGEAKKWLALNPKAKRGKAAQPANVVQMKTATSPQNLAAAQMRA